MESAPSPFQGIKEYPDDPWRADVTIDRISSATFAYDQSSGEIIRAGVFVDSPSLDIPEVQFIGINRLKNAEARALAYFKSKAAREAAKNSVAPGTQYDLDLGDQTLH